MNGSAVLPDRNVCRTTEKAPIWSPTIPLANDATRMRRPLRSVPRERLVDQRVGDEARVDPEVPDVAPQRQQPPVGEEERLDRQHRGHDQEGGVRSEEDREDHPAPEVTARSGPRDREVDHLGGEDEGAQHPHQGDLPVVEMFLQLLRRVTDRADRPGPERGPHRGGEQRVRHVHGRLSSKTSPRRLPHDDTIDTAVPSWATSPGSCRIIKNSNSCR